MFGGPGGLKPGFFNQAYSRRGSSSRSNGSRTDASSSANSGRNDEIKLRGGVSEAKSVVAVLRFSYKELVKADPELAAAFTLKCHDSNFSLTQDQIAKLQQRGLIEPNGRIHDSIRNIIRDCTDIFRA